MALVHFLAIISIVLIIGTVFGEPPSQIKIYRDADPYPNEETLVVDTISNIPDLTIYGPPNTEPVAICSNGT
jgi:hypothetical protein